MSRYHKMADGHVRRCTDHGPAFSCGTCHDVPVWGSSEELLDEAYRENEVRDGVNWVANNTGNVVTRLTDGTPVSLLDGARHQSIPMPEICVLVKLDVDRKGNALKPEQVRSRARTASTASLPEARYNGLPRGSNRDAVWGAQWGKGNSFSLPCTTPSSRLVPRRLQATARDMIDRSAG